MAIITAQDALRHFCEECGDYCPLGAVHHGEEQWLCQGCDIKLTQLEEQALAAFNAIPPLVESNAQAFVAEVEGEGKDKELPDEEWYLALSDAGPGAIAACGCVENAGYHKNCAEGRTLWEALSQAVPVDRTDMDGSYMCPSLEEEERYNAAIDAWDAHVGVVLTPEEQAAREDSRQQQRQCGVSITYGPAHDPYGATCDLERGHDGPHEGHDPLGFDGKDRMKWTGGGRCAGDALPFQIVH